MQLVLFPLDGLVQMRGFKYNFNNYYAFLFDK